MKQELVKWSVTKKNNLSMIGEILRMLGVVNWWYEDGDICDKKDGHVIEECYLIIFYATIDQIQKFKNEFGRKEMFVQGERVFF